MVEDNADVSSGKDNNGKKSKSVAADRTKKQSKMKKKKNILILFSSTNTMMIQMPYKRASTRRMVSGRPSAMLILVSLIQFTMGRFLSL